MNEIVSKISSYNIFNYLFPGAAFCTALASLGIYRAPDEIVERLLWYYFVGLACSRIGSLLFEPIAQTIGFIDFKPYHEFIHASKEDLKIELLVEVANTYRTLATCCAIVFALQVVEANKGQAPSQSPFVFFITVSLFLIFCFSYRKQCAFIVSRVNYTEKQNGM